MASRIVHVHRPVGPQHFEINVGSCAPGRRGAEIQLVQGRVDPDLGEQRLLAGVVDVPCGRELEGTAATPLWRALTILPPLAPVRKIVAQPRPERHAQLRCRKLRRCHFEPRVKEVWPHTRPLCGTRRRRRRRPRLWRRRRRRPRRHKVHLPPAGRAIVMLPGRTIGPRTPRVNEPQHALSDGHRPGRLGDDERPPERGSGPSPLPAGPHSRDVLRGIQRRQRVPGVAVAHLARRLHIGIAQKDLSAAWSAAGGVRADRSACGAPLRLPSPAPVQGAAPRRPRRKSRPTTASAQSALRSRRPSSSC